MKTLKGKGLVCLGDLQPECNEGKAKVWLIYQAKRTFKGNYYLKIFWKLQKIMLLTKRTLLEIMN